MNILSQKRIDIKKKEKDLLLQVANLENIKKYLSHGYHKGLVRVLNYLLGISNNCSVVFPTQKTIGDACDLDSTSVHLICKRLKKLGFITMTNRRIKQNVSKDNPVGQTSNLYVMHPIFRDMTVRDYLKSLLPMLSFLPLAFLMFANSNNINADSRNLQSMDSGSSAESSYGNVFNIFIYNPNPHPNNPIPYCAHVDAREELGRLGFNKKRLLERKVVMPNDEALYDNDLFTSTVRRAGRELHMTLAGMCSTAAFSDMVISTALTRLKEYRKEIESPYGFFIGACRDISREMGIAVKGARSYAKAKEIGIELGREESVFEQGKLPRKPKPKTPQKGKSYSSHQQQDHSQAKHHVSSAITTVTGAFTMHELQDLNPELDLTDAVFVSPTVVKVINHAQEKEAWRETTQEERDEWDRRKAECLNGPHADALRSLGIMMPDAPTHFYGNPNYTRSRNYSIDSEGRLYLKGDHARSEVTPVQTVATLRPLTPLEEELISWFRDYYRFMKKNFGKVPAWYESMTRAIKNRDDTLERYLTVAHHALESNGWTRNSDGSFIQNTTKHDEDFTSDDFM